MRIAELLYFAPGVRFDEVDFYGENLPDQFEHRVRSFYLEPAIMCAEAGAAFAAGVLLLACIDALARMKTGMGKVGTRFKNFALSELASFSDGNRAERLYDAFRNGLIHEGRIKAGAQFSFDIESTVDDLQGVLVINPRRLAHEVERALENYIAELRADKKLRALLVRQITEDHEADRQN